MKRKRQVLFTLVCFGLLVSPSMVRGKTSPELENSVQDLVYLLWDANPAKGALNQDAIPAARMQRLKAMEPECKVFSALPGPALLEEFITTHEARRAAQHNLSIQLNRAQQRMAIAGTAGDLTLFKAELVRAEGGSTAQHIQKMSAANTERIYAATRWDAVMVNALEYATITGFSTFGLLLGNSTAVWFLPYSSPAYWPATAILVTPYQRGG